jgi:hypothetical protein
MRKRIKVKIGEGDEPLLRIMATATGQANTTLLLTLKNALVVPNAQWNVRSPRLNW